MARRPGMEPDPDSLVVARVEAELKELSPEGEPM
jgi:hypothetical protein